MPIIHRSDYHPPPALSNGHLQTILPALFRRVKGVRYHRWRLPTPDGDFLDLDLSRVGASRLALICHGLEGSSKAGYVLGVVRAFNRSGWDAAALNFRGCSGEPNRRYRSYHSGATDDLHHVVSHLVSRGIGQIGLIGFSLGGNVVLRYLGERESRLPRPVCGAGAVSVPCDLASSARRMERPDNRVYLIRFLRSLRKKVVEKARRKPGRLSPRQLKGIRTFREFDDTYTAPAHGYRDAEDYWRRCRSLPVLHRIRLPTLLVNALDDPFLAPECFPYREASGHPYLHLETPRSGGHVGFVSLPFPSRFWHETRLVTFLDSASVSGIRRLRSY